ncbi:DNA-binding protein [Corynebacterium heidelbergense]|uniref:DNA-binding protein n=1 Tax=Corynebacterium heidelbergense TaxID=2055947 RepID=A0A364V665_9CORY|nr:DNA-binding protein [Corynebacterium heidelbergense]RAV32096.1 DNA-binding protein [Corynebacterium heidelbergense]
MFAIHASYRGRARRRAEFVRNVAAALAESPVAESVRQEGITDISCVAIGPENAGGVILALLQVGDFALGLGSLSGTDLEGGAEEAGTEGVEAAARRACPPSQRAGSVGVRIERADVPGTLMPGRAADIAEDIAAAFTLLSYVLSRRTEEGRQATALLRAGLSQSEAAREAGISKQAMSQRLAAAGWHAEQAGWSLAIRMLARADEVR